MSNFEHAFFYGSENHDRVYNATSFEYWIKKFFTSGVFTGDLQVTANDNMTITISSGYINIGGKVKFYEQPQEILLETAHATYDRIDCIVIERNDSIRDFVVKVVPGGYSSNPIPQIPERKNGIDQRVLAQVSVTHGAVRITQADVTDTRADPELCGIVAGTVKEMDFSQFQAQFDSYFSNYKTEVKEEFEGYIDEIQRLEAEYQSMFLAWFEKMKDQLSEDAAGNIQQQIDAMTDKIHAVDAKIDVLDTKEEIEANTDTEKMAGALAVKEMFGEVTSNLSELNGEKVHGLKICTGSIRVNLDANGSATITMGDTFTDVPLAFAYSGNLLDIYSATASENKLTVSNWNYKNVNNVWCTYIVIGY